MALRIFVNEELKEIEEALKVSPLVEEGGKSSVNTIPWKIYSKDFKMKKSRYWQNMFIPLLKR